MIGRGGGDRRGRRASASSRLVPMLFTFVGVLVVVATQAAQRGLVTGVTLAWPAYLFGGVLIVIGILGVGGRESDDEAPAEDAAADDEPARRGGLAAGAAEKIARMRATLQHVEDARRARPRDFDH